MSLLRLLTIGFILGVIPVAFGQRGTGATPASTNEVPPESESGIPVNDALTVQKCGSCHKADNKQNLTRISWIRTTPEGWEQAIKRMVRLNGLTLSPEEARHILNYLAQDHGLAPEEVAPHRWYLEMRQPISEPTPNPQVRIACASCHPFARPETWRRTPTEWKLLVNMHLGYFPVSEYNSFHARPRPDGYGILPAALTTTLPAQPSKDPVDEALDYLNKNYNLHSAAWSNWRAVLKEPKLAGTWFVSAHAPGKGKYFGTMTIAAGASPNTFKSETILTRVADGSKISFSGQSIIYTGYEWRGRSNAEGIGSVREVMALTPDQSKLEGRWFWGGYQEFGFDVVARRPSADITILGTNLSAIHAGSQNVALKIIGANFPRNLTTADVDMGAGVHVRKIVSVKAGEISVLVDVDPKLVSGFRSVSVKSFTAPDAFAVYDKIDYIKVGNDSSLAHLGGTTHPKGYIQFEAVAYNRGLDGVPNTADDINLGPITAKWTIEEFIARYNDDDKEFVGSISADGLFTPAGEGPNQQRRFTTNNTGDVWIVAKYQDKDSGPTPLTAKSYLVVTVPVYMKWDQPEVAQ
jgi:quinohemoprotein amine dehydrogenase